jgi:recombination protein RecT
MKAAQDGLLPDGKEAALVPFKGSVTYMPMLGGILKKVRNSGELASITAHVIYKNDQFRYWVDSDGEHVTHEPLLFGERGEACGAYALAKTKDGAVYIEVLTDKDLRAIENSSRSKEGPWTGPFRDEMKKKSAIRRLAKRLPMSTDVEQVIERDDEMYDITPPQNVEPEPKIVPKKTSARLSKLVEADIVSEPKVESTDTEEII